jgi:hypothetical protein
MINPRSATPTRGSVRLLLEKSTEASCHGFIGVGPIPNAPSYQPCDLLI